jgi:hypothetical protein
VAGPVTSQATGHLGPAAHVWPAFPYSPRPAADRFAAAYQEAAARLRAS